MKTIIKKTLPFLGIAFLLTIISTSINNFYFYKNIEVKSKYEIRNTAKFIHNFSLDCMNDYHDQKKCIKKLTMLIRGLKVPYGQKIIIRDTEGKSLLYVDSTSNKKRKEIRLSDDKGALDLQNLNVFKSRIEISKNVIPNISKTVWNSMTLSLSKIAFLWKKKGYDKARNYFEFVAWPRSRPALWFFLISLTIVSLSNLIFVRLREMYERKQKKLIKIHEKKQRVLEEKHLLDIKQQENYLRKKQQRINEIHKSLAGLYERQNSQIKNENERLKKVIKLLEEQKSKILDDAIIVALKKDFEVTQVQCKYDLQTQKIEKLKTERKAGEKEIEKGLMKLQIIKNNLPSKQRLLDYLFGNKFNNKLSIKILGEFNSNKKTLERELKKELGIINLDKLTIDHSDNKDLKSNNILKNLKRELSSYDFIVTTNLHNHKIKGSDNILSTLEKGDFIPYISFPPKKRPSKSKIIQEICSFINENGDYYGEKKVA